MVALDLEDFAAVIRVRGRIEHAQLPPARSRAREEIADVGAHQLAFGHTVQAQVVTGPVEIGLRGVHRRRLQGAAFRRRTGERTRIGKQVEKPLRARFFPHQRPGLAMVGEQSGVDVVVEVDEELQISLAHLDALALARQPLVLLARPPLPEVHALPRDLERIRRRARHRLQPGNSSGLLARILGDDEVPFVPVDRRADLGNVAIVDPERADAPLLEARMQFAKVLPHAVGEHPRLLVEIQSVAAQRSI